MTDDDAIEVINSVILNSADVSARDITGRARTSGMIEETMVLSDFNTIASLPTCSVLLAIHDAGNVIRTDGIGISHGMALSNADVFAGVTVTVAMCNPNACFIFSLNKTVSKEELVVLLASVPVRLSITVT